MVGWGNDWLNCIVIDMQKWTLSVRITAHHPLMMACIYTNTQTCTYTVHTVYLYSYCTHAHMSIYTVCMCLGKIWVRPHHCDRRVGFWGHVNIDWPKNNMIHHQRGTLRKLVRLWNVALFPFFYFSRYVLFCRCSEKPLYGIVVCDVTNICFVYLASSSFTLLLKAACGFLFFLFFFLFSFLWSDAFYQSNRLAAVFEWPGPHTHTSQSVQTENKCTDNQRERDGWGGRHPGSGGPVRPGPCWARAIWKSNIDRVYMHL